MATTVGGRSAVQHELLGKQLQHDKPPAQPEYMAFETQYNQLLSLVTECPDDFAIRAFERAMIDTSTLDDIQSSLATDREKATRLLSEIGQMIRTSVPQAFEQLLQILSPESHSTVVRGLTNLMEVYEILTELKNSSADELNLDTLAEKLLYKGLITQETYKECMLTEEKQGLSKVNLLFNQVSKQGASQAFLSILETFTNTRDLVGLLRLKSDGFSTTTSSEYSPSVVGSAGCQTDNVLTDELEDSIESTDENMMGSMYSPDVVHSPDSSTSSEQFHSLYSGYATMVSGTFTNEALSDSTLPSLERRSSPVSRTSLNATTLGDTLSPHMSAPKAPPQWEDPFKQFLAAVECNDASAVGAILLKHQTPMDSLVNLQYKDGSTALHVAATNGYHDIVKVLLDHKASVNAQDHHGNTPLHLAASCGNYEVVKLLVGAFANVDAVTKDGTPMLLHPSSKGFSMVTEYLLKNGAKPNHANQLGVTPLIAATRRGKKDVVRVLLQHGADVNPVSLETSWSALEEAVHGEHTEIVTMLIKAKSKADDRSRALFTCKSPETLQTLVKEGAKLDGKRGDGATPLIVHTELGNFEVVKVLIELNANVDLQDEAGCSALMKAAQSGNLEVLRLLVAAEAILDRKSKQGLTSLMYAVKHQNVPVAKELLVAGADRNARDKRGKTVVELAEEQGCEEIVELLQQQASVSDTGDPFVQLLSTYFVKAADSKASSELSLRSQESSAAAPKTPLKQHLGRQADPSAAPFPQHPLPKLQSDDDSTFNDQLQKSWKRIADIETRIHDLTLQATMETPEASDLSYLDRRRLEEEFRKLKELRKKAERYAIEAKQTAQRLSAENFKLKEDLSRERHYNELTRKNMIREMEQKMDKSATALDRADARLEVFEQDVNERALQMIRRVPTPSLAIQLPWASIDKKALETALLEKERMMPLCIAQCITVGAPQTGKSSLKRRLLKQTGQPSKSTGVAEKPVVIAVTVEGDEWIVLEWEEEGAQFLRGIEQQPSADIEQVPSSSEERSSKPEESEVLQTSHYLQEASIATNEPRKETGLSVDVSTEFDEHEYSLSSSNSTDKDKELNTVGRNEPELHSYQDLIDTILSLQFGSEKWIAAKMRLQNQCTIYFTDTGGQLEFMEVLPAIISGPSIFLLVFNLEHAANGLDNEIPAVYKRSDGSVYKPPPGISTFTVRDLILHILASVQTTRSYHFKKDGKDQVIEAKVLLVGTHSDCVTDASVRDRIESDVQELLRDTPYYLKGMLQVPCREPGNERFVYMVNNESAEDSVFQEIREKVRSLIFEESGDSDYKEDISAQWLGFDLMLRWPGKSKILTYQQCADMAKSCGIGESDVKQALAFLHRRFGIIRYFSGAGLDNNVITNPQVIYDSISDLIAVKFNYSNTRLTPEEVRDFQKKGLISEDAVRKCIASQRNETTALSLKFLLSLLSHLHIVVELEGDKVNLETMYFMPCVLVGAKHDLSKSADYSEPNVPDLLIVFDRGDQYCPKGLFSVFAINLAKQHLAKYTWVLNRKQLDREQIVFNIIFNVEELRCRYTVYIQHGILGYRSVLRIFVRKLPDCSCLQLSPKHLESLCKEIRDSVRRCLNSSLEKLQLSTNFNIGFYSTCGEKHHIAIIEDLTLEDSGVLQDMTCVDCDDKVCAMRKEHKVWFPEVPQELNSRSEEKPTLPELLNFTLADRKVSIATEIGDKYVRFGTILLQDTTGSRVKNMAHKCLNDPERINSEILQEWLIGRGKSPVTWATLIEVLHDIGLFALADTVQCQLSNMQ